MIYLYMKKPFTLDNLRSLVSAGIVGVAVVILMTSATPVQASFKDDVINFANRFNPFIGNVALADTVDDGPSFPVADTSDPIRTLTVIATAYSSDENQTDDTPCFGAMWKYDLCEAYTVRGVEDTIAANFLPLGTVVRFPDMYGDKTFVVRDRMNARYNYETLGYYRIDFYKAAVTEDGKYDNATARTKAVQFGIKRGLRMEILARVK